MTIGASRAIFATGRDFAHAVATTRVNSTAPGAPTFAPAHQGRGNAALYELARIERMARRSDIVDPDLEPPPEFDINSPTPDHDMEPLDPSIESSVDRVTVSGDEDQVTITAEDGETIVSVTDDDGDVEVDVEDTADVLLAHQPQQRVDDPEDDKPPEDEDEQ